MKQESFSDMEYRSRKKKTKREEFLEIMDEIIPWEEWVCLPPIPSVWQGQRKRLYQPPDTVQGALCLCAGKCPGSDQGGTAGP